jgi:hypothetical protein
MKSAQTNSHLETGSWQPKLAAHKAQKTTAAATGFLTLLK